MEKYKAVIDLMDRIINDRTVPRNIRQAVEDAKNSLFSNDPEELRVSSAITTLDEITNDPNMPLYTRTQIWNIVSLLEQIRRKIKK